MSDWIDTDAIANAAFWSGRAAAARRAEAARPSVGRTVEVVRGRKVAIGTVGVVGWFGETRWGHRVGLIIEGVEGLTFTDAGNVRVVRDEDVVEGEDAEERAAIFDLEERIEAGAR